MTDPKINSFLDEGNRLFLQKNTNGILDKECSELLRLFFKSKRSKQ